jgi:hypothetical protein
METLFVRLKPYDPRRGQLIRRFTYRGIKFHDDRGWLRVPKEVADYLREVREVPSDQHSSLAFDVCTEAEAKSLDAAEQESAVTRKTASEATKVSLPEDEAPAGVGGERASRKSKKA